MIEKWKRKGQAGYLSSCNTKFILKAFPPKHHLYRVQAHNPLSAIPKSKKLLKPSGFCLSSTKSRMASKAYLNWHGAI